MVRTVRSHVLELICQFPMALSCAMVAVQLLCTDVESIDWRSVRTLLGTVALTDEAAMVSTFMANLLWIFPFYCCIDDLREIYGLIPLTPS